MKKILGIFAIALLFVSCSNDDDTQEPFFNLKEGNLWVYKRYTIDINGKESFNNIVDTVKVIGQETIEGKAYFKLSHSRSSTGYNYLRVDERGCLVNDIGHIIHPGATNYTYSHNIHDGNGRTLGVLSYQLENAKDVTVEGQSYSVYPYVCYLTSDKVPSGIGGYNYYKPGIGSIVIGARFITAMSYIEDRLVYYELK